MALNGNGDTSNGDAQVQEPTEPVDKRKVFVGGLSTDTVEDDLKTYFSQFGAVQNATVKRDPTSGRSRCFAFVTFMDSSAVKAVHAVSNHQLKGKKIDPKPAEPRPGEEPITKVFVGGVDTAMDEGELKSYFEKFGAVKAIEWPKDRLRDGAKKNFAFVEFESDAIVNEIIKNPKQTIGGRQCDVRKAIPSQPKQSSGGAGGWGDYSNPYGSYNYGSSGYGSYGTGGYGDQYAQYYGQGYDQTGYYDANSYYGGYDYSSGGYDYSNGTNTGTDSAGGYGGAAGGSRGGSTRGGGRGGGRGSSRGGGSAGGRGGGRGGSRGFHPYQR